MIGRNMTTTGVSLTKALAIVAAPSTITIAPMPVRPPRRASSVVGFSRASVWNRPWPTTRRASTVISAGLARPASSSSGPSGLVVPLTLGTAQNSTSQPTSATSETSSIAQRSSA